MKCYVHRELYGSCIDSELCISFRGHYNTGTITLGHLDWFFRIDFRTAKDVSNHKLDITSDDIFSRTFWEF